MSPGSTSADGGATQLMIGGRELRITSGDKILFPSSGRTKRDVIDYYARVGPFMVPHLTGRPITMKRYPKGVSEDGFFQKQAPKFFPDWIPRVGLVNKDRTTQHAVIDETAALVVLAQQNTITPHVGLMRRDDLDHPDRYVVDLDPSTDDFVMVRHTALTIRDVFVNLGLTPFVQTTGSSGLHIVVPLDRSDSWPAIHAFGRALATVLVARHPDLLTTAFHKIDRGDRIYLDLGRNAPLATMAAPYALRARPGAPVATPIDWDEVDDPSLSPQRYDIDSVFDRLDTHGDPWASIDDEARPLPATVSQRWTLI